MASVLNGAEQGAEASTQPTGRCPQGEGSPGPRRSLPCGVWVLTEQARAPASSR